MTVGRAWPLVAALICVCIAIAGCGGGGAVQGGASLTGTVEGNVFMPGNRSGSGAAFLAMDRSGPPSGYEPVVGATVTATVGDVPYRGVTDGNGHFAIAGVPEGLASVSVTPPAGSGFREFTTTVSVLAGGRVKIGQDGDVSLLTGTAGDLGVAINSVDASLWPTVRAHVTVLDPDADAAIIGMAMSNFALRLNDQDVVAFTLSTEMTVGANPHQVYVLMATMSGAEAGYVRAELSANYSGRTGSASGASGVAATFVAPLGNRVVSNSFKDPDYATDRPGKWHMGADIPAPENTRVNAAARGVVTQVIMSQQETGVVVRHRVSSDLQTAGGTTRNTYVLYGCITPTVTVVGSVVEPGQEIGRLRLHSDGSRLHLGLRVGEAITSAWGDGNLDGGQIPVADAFGLTDGWTDPVSFLAGHTPDNIWVPG